MSKFVSMYMCVCIFRHDQRESPRNPVFFILESMRVSLHTHAHKYLYLHIYQPSLTSSQTISPITVNQK